MGKRKYSLKALTHSILDDDGKDVKVPIVEKIAKTKAPGN
jgi:hypothetical protein